MSGNRTSAPQNMGLRYTLLALVLPALFIVEWINGGPNAALGILNMGLISAILALGVNLQWGYAGLFNVGIVGFIALGGLAPVLVAMPPTEGAMVAGGWRIALALLAGAAAIALAVAVNRRAPRKARIIALPALAVAGFVVYRLIFDPGVAAVQAINPSATGYLGGLGLPTLLAWPLGAALAAGAAWAIGKTALGLRSDYLAIATLGIGEIIVAVLKNEEWLSRGVMNVNGIPRPWPVPYEIDIQADLAFVERAASLGLDPVTASTVLVKLLYTALFAAVLVTLIWLSQRALNSPWGRMMRAIRDNEISAAAMGKDVTRRHLQIFILGSAVCGLAGAMLISLDGQMIPSGYNPLRYTFLIWVMVIVGGSGNNWGSVVGGVLIWYLWIKAEVWGPQIMDLATTALPPGDLKTHLLDSAAHMRLLVMGLVLILMLRFSPSGLLPER
jgi:branched-chain amino acid transport system permease protein